ncbi:transcriptional regulator GutM [Sodalis sp. RH16]|uniref:transcriptional regulator GutM n=1 Tax=Sodalis sp. RH16 TaxID=3394331 RepID=UPI0039B5A247
MHTINILIFLALFSWVVQIILGWFQIQHFNKSLARLSEKGKIYIGRSTGRFSPRIVVAVSVDEQERVTGNFIMKGLTVFSRSFTESKLNGEMITEIKPRELFPKDRKLQQALTALK